MLKMWKRTCLLVWTGCLAGTLVTSAYGEEPLSVLEYLGGRASRMAVELPDVPDDAAGWEQRSTQIRQDLARLLGLPEREPMKAAVTDRKEHDDLVIEDVMYLWAERAYVSANVVRRKDAEGRRPGLVVPPGWLGHYTQPCYKSFVFHMADLGYVVLFIDDPHVGQRQSPYAGLYAVASAAGTQVMGIQVFDTLRGLDYMLTRADVDPGRIGVVGLCQGSEQTWLAGALEDRFQFAVPVCGTTTYEGWARMPAFEGVSLSDPSPYVGDVLRFTDWDRIDACIAPRPVLVVSNSGDNWWPVAGYDKVIETMTKVYGLCGAGDRFRHVRDLRSHDMTPYIPEIAPWIEDQVESLSASEASPLPCGEPEEPDFKMLRYFQRRIAARAESFPTEFDAKSDWEAYREAIEKWLRDACDLASMHPAGDKVVEVTETEGVVVERLALGLDADLSCPAILVRPSGPAQGKRPSLILSHSSGQCIGSSEIVEAAHRLAARGYWVIVPEHASLNSASLQPAEGRGLVSFYGVADTVGLPPLALRVADDLAAFRHLAGRPEIDADRIVVAGLGAGAIDACLASVLEGRIAGAACVDVTTTRDWAENVAPETLNFTRVMPYLPSMLTRTDLDYYFAALAPRPLLVARLIDGWPESGFEQVAATTSLVYGLCGSGESLMLVGPRGLTEEQENKAPEGVQKQLIAATRALMPEPPTPGLVGTTERLKSRQVVDSAAGIVWVVSEMSGFDQALVDGGYRLDTWSFFNDNGPAQQDRVVTPLIFKKEGDRYELTGVGATRTNTGAGLQTSPFEAVEGSNEVAAGYYFGWHTGDPSGQQNAGVVEFNDGPRDRMTILTVDGGLSNQKIAVGNTYREQSHYPRAYSIRAISKRE
ncbi:MAG: dienelactone hydrolase family protein [Planctomycetota bacterium]